MILDLDRVRRRQATGSVLFLVVLALAAARPVAAAEPLSVHDLARLRSVLAAEVSPGGERIAYLLAVPRDPFEEDNGPAWTELHLVDAAGESRPYVSGAVELERLAWTPDGKAVSFLAKRGDDEHEALYRIPVDGGEARRVVGRETAISDYSWSPDGARVAVLAERALAAERKELKEKGFDQEVVEEEPRPVELWIAPAAGGGEPRRLELPGSASELHWSPAGERLAVALAPTPLIDDDYMRRRVHIVDAESGAVVGEVEHEGKLGQVAWSPDGRWLAMIAAEDLHDPLEGRLHLAPASGGTPRDLLPGHPGHVSAIAWAGNEAVVALVDEGVRTRLYRVAADGSGRETLLESEEAVWTSLTLSRDAGVAALVGESPGHPAEVFRWGSGSEGAARLTDSNPWLAERRLARQEVIRYPARDGLEIEGLLVRPLDETAGRRYPLVVMVHGGPESHLRNGWLSIYSRPAQVLAGKGIASFYPNYRGSTGRGVEFSKLSQGDPAGAEFDDLVDGVDYLIGLGLADPRRIGITGGSYGGYATAWASTYYSERFAAGVMFVGISDEISKIGTSDIPHELHLVHVRRWPWEDWSLSLERSPIYHVEKARTPLLILHGRKDTRVFPGQSMELFRFLKVLGRVPVRLVLYPEEAHGNRKAASRLDYSLRSIRWFEHYLKGEGGEPPAHELVYREEPAEADGE